MARKKKENLVTDVVAEPVENGTTISVNDEIKVNEPDTVVICANYPQGITVETPFGKFRINSNSEALRGKERGILPTPGTFGITTNVPVKAWEWFAKQYKHWGILKKGLIFATTPDKVRSEIAKRKNLFNGYEPIKAEVEAVK